MSPALIPCHRPRKGRKLRRVSAKVAGAGPQSRPRDHNGLAPAWPASFSTVPPPTGCDESKQIANACRVARVAKTVLHVRIACAAVYPVAFALRSRSLLCIGRSAPRLFFFSMVRTSAGSAGSCALQRVLEASLALSVFGFCTSCAVASLSIGTVAGRTSQSEGPGGAGLPHVPAGAVATPCCYFVMPACEPIVLGHWAITAQDCTVSQMP